MTDRKATLTIDGETPIELPILKAREAKTSLISEL